MYIIINKTTNKTEQLEGNYPSTYVKALLDRGDDIIIISLYSNTIKIPYSYKEYGITFWDNKEYSLPKEIIKEEYLINNGK